MTFSFEPPENARILSHGLPPSFPLSRRERWNVAQTTSSGGVLGLNNTHPDALSNESAGVHSQSMQ